MRHIFRKLDINSGVDLTRLVDAARRGPRRRSIYPEGLRPEVPTPCVARSAQARSQRLAPPGREQFEKRASDVQLRIADKITAFAGSMHFVYLHALFAVWMLVFEKSPWPTLTLIVSLEAIFLSTFVMIGQNRQAAFQQAKADHDYQDVNTLLVENTNLTRAINHLTEELHHHVLGGGHDPLRVVREHGRDGSRREGDATSTRYRALVRLAHQSARSAQEPRHEIVASAARRRVPRLRHPSPPTSRGRACVDGRRSRPVSAIDAPTAARTTGYPAPVRHPRATARAAPTPHSA